MSTKSYFRTTPNYGQMGYDAAYGYVSWNGKPEGDLYTAAIAADRAKTAKVPEGKPTELFVANFIRYINEH